MKRSLADSEKLYEQVKSFFWKSEEGQFFVVFSGAKMANWEIIPGLTEDGMNATHRHLCEMDEEFACFARFENRYCFSFKDQNFRKVQFLDTGEIDYRYVYQDFDMEKVISELKALMKIVNSD